MSSFNIMQMIVIALFLVAASIAVSISGAVAVRWLSNGFLLVWVPLMIWFVWFRQ